MRNLRNSYTNWCLQMKERQFECMFFLKLGGEMIRKHRDDFRRLETDRYKKATSYKSFSKCNVRSMIKMIILLLLTIIAAQSTVKAEEDLEMTFDAKQVIEMKLISHLKATTQDAKITLLFKTIQPSGIIFLANGLNGDFIFMEMVRGKLRIVLGTKNAATNLIHADILLEDNLCDNEWHQLELNILQDVTHARIDSWDGYTSRTVKRLQIDRNIILGGQYWDNLSNISVSNRNYSGCLSYVIFNDKDVLHSLRKRHSNLKWVCLETAKNDLINFDQPRSNVQFSNPIITDLKVGLWFRTYHRDGVLFTNIATDLLKFHKDTEGITVFMLYFQNNELKLRLNGKTIITAIPKDKIDFGSWQRVDLLIANGTASLHLNNDASVYRFKAKLARNYGSIISVGNHVGNVPNFMGWVRDVTINRERMTYMNATKIKDVSIGIYRMKDVCYPNPCNNSGVCIQSENGPLCDCTNTGYSGDRCDQKVVEYKRTCAEYYENGKTKSGEYFIKPGTEAFKVFCDMDHKDGPVTRVINDRKSQRKAIYESTSSDNKFHYHQIKYGVAMDQLKYLIETSERCQQFVEYYCSKSTLMFSNNKIASLLNRYGARWYSRGGAIQSYWGGASKNSFKCACGMNNSCADSRLACNCDAFDSRWRSDGGFLRYKEDLPVTMLQFSKRNTNPAAMYTLGPLECFGNHTDSLETSRNAKTTKTQGTKYTTHNEFTTQTLHVTSTSAAPTKDPTKTTLLVSTKQSSPEVKYTTIRQSDLEHSQTDRVTSSTRIKSTKNTSIKKSSFDSGTSSSLPAITSSFSIPRGSEKDTDTTPKEVVAMTDGSLSAEIAVTEKTATRKTASVLVVHQPAKQSESLLSNKQMFILIALISSLTLFTILLIVVVLRQRIFSYSSKKLTVELKQDIENPNKYAFQLPNNNTGSFSDSNSQSRSMQDINKIEIVQVGSIFAKQLPSESESSVNSLDASRYLEIGEESDSGSYTSFTKPKSILKANKFLLTSRPRSEGDQFDIQEPGEVIGLIHVKGKQKSSQYDESSELLADSTFNEDSHVNYPVRTKSQPAKFYQGNHIEHIGCGRNESIDADTGFITDSSLSSNSRKSLSSSGSDESNDEFFMQKNIKLVQRSKRSVRFSLNEDKTDLKSQNCAEKRTLYQECDDEVFS